MGTKADPGACDCYAKAEPDEPLFVLLARDKHAPALVWLWAVLRELDGEKPETVAEARTCCAAMLLWAQEHGRQAVGVGQSVLAGVLELIRTANYAVEKHAANVPTGEEFMRLLMNFTRFQDAPPATAPGNKP
jgi:hypothetical protein